MKCLPKRGNTRDSGSFHVDTIAIMAKNCLESVSECKVSLYEGKGEYLQWTRKADNHEVQSDKSEKSLICCDAMERRLHNVNVEWNV